MGLVPARGRPKLNAMRHLIAACALLGLLASAAEADQRDPRLPALFSKLKAAKTVETALPIEAEIWTIWAQSDNDDVNLLMGLGINAMEREDYGTALELFDKMIEVAPDFAEGWNKRATVLYLMGELDRSHADVQKVLELEPRHFGALSGLGLLHMAQGEAEKALDAFRRALAVHPSMPGPQRWVEELKETVEGQPI
jgi:tetratricopeptide (TPR) repeat protein